MSNDIIPLANLESRQRRVARGLEQHDARFEPVQNEMIFAGFGRLDVRLGKYRQRHRAAVSQFTSDNRFRTTPPRFVSIERMIDDDPKLVVGKIERRLVLVLGAPGIGSNKQDLQDFAGDRSRYALERSGRT